MPNNKIFRVTRIRPQAEELRRTLAATKQREEKCGIKSQSLQVRLTEMTEQCEDLRRTLRDDAGRMETFKADKKALESEVACDESFSELELYSGT